MLEIKKTKKIILFIDEIHTLIGAGAAEGAVDAANILKPALARGEIQCVGATTLDEYRKYMERDAALERRFQPIIVNEPSVEETIDILKGIRKKYEEHHRVVYSDEALETSARLSSRYISDRFLPDKAVDLIDEAGAKARMKITVMPKELKEVEKELDGVRRDKQNAVKNQDFETAAKLRDSERKIKKSLEERINKWKTEKRKSEITISASDIEEIVSKWTGIPLARLAGKETERLLKMEKEIHKRLIDQTEAVSAISRAVRRSRTGMKDPKKPTGTFLFLGPTGVGKTELAKALAEFLFGNEEAMVRVDMSEFMEKHSVSRLVGAPPGYVGYQEGGQLTEAVRRRPYSVILLDEIEKAHPDVFNILLQMMDDGRLTDHLGHTVNFRNAVIIMTSNIGAREIQKDKNFGFVQNEYEKDYDTMRKGVMSEVKRLFNPEFLNRLDEIIVFHPLNRKDMRRIAKIMVERLAERTFSTHRIKLKLDASAYDYLIQEGFDEKYGARNLRRTIQKLLEDRLAQEILNSSVKEGNSIEVYKNDDDDKLKFKKI